MEQLISYSAATALSANNDLKAGNALLVPDLLIFDLTAINKKSDFEEAAEED